MSACPALSQSSACPPAWRAPPSRAGGSPADSPRWPAGGCPRLAAAGRSRAAGTAAHAGSPRRRWRARAHRPWPDSPPAVAQPRVSALISALASCSAAARSTSAASSLTSSWLLARTAARCPRPPHQRRAPRAVAGGTSPGVNGPRCVWRCGTAASIRPRPRSRQRVRPATRARSAMAAPDPATAPPPPGSRLPQAEPQPEQRRAAANHQLAADRVDLRQDADPDRRAAR